MKTTAEKFRQKPHDIYRAADRGETIVINHDRYRDKVFELRARDRNPLGARWVYVGNASDFYIGKEVVLNNEVLVVAQIDMLDNRVAVKAP